jgi:putative ABC transport system permease protein
MNLSTIVLRGLFRRPVRTSLTLVGIALGIAAVIALVGISRGFEASWVTGLKSRGTDIGVSNMRSAITPKPFTAAVVDRIKPLPRVAATCSLLVDFVSVEKADLMIVSARQWGCFVWNNLKVVKGRLPKDGDEKAVVLGTSAAEVLGKKPGDKLQLETEELEVVGIVDGGAFVENGSVILSLSVYQEITGNQGKISVVDVSCTPGTTKEQMQELIKQINAVVPEANAVLATENLRDSQAYRIIHAMSWSTSLLAVVVGVLGVMNTMLMSVFERTQEICVLLAIGWKRLRIVRMILLESFILGLLGGVGGAALGFVGVKMLGHVEIIHGLLEPDLSAELFLRGVLIAVVVGVASGLYPAWRSSRLMPSQALHY